MRQTSKVLKQVDIFYKLSDDQIEQVASISSEREYRYGELVFEENSTGNELYVIAQGAIDIVVDPNLVDPDSSDPGPVETIIRLERGQSFGEIALVDRGSRSASAQVAENETQLISIPREGLIRLCAENPKLGYQLMRNLAADLAMKLRKTDFALRGSFLKE